MFKATMTNGLVTVSIPNFNGLRLIDAIQIVDTLKKFHPELIFTVTNEENGNIEYKV